MATFDQTRIEEINQRYNNGESIRSIATSFGVDPKTIKKKISNFDKNRKYIPPKKEIIAWDTTQDRDKLIETLAKQHNAPTIARKLGINKSTVYDILKSKNITTNHRAIYYKLDEKTEEQISQLYGTVPTVEISKRFGIGTAHVVRIRKRHNLPVDNSQTSLRRTVGYDECNFFSKLNNPEKLYILGLICSDGNIYHNVLTIGLQIGDIKLLESIKDCVGFGKISTVKTTKSAQQNNLARYRICRFKVIEDLKTHGVIDFKNDKPEFLDKFTDDEFKSFLLGFFDGDGVLAHKSSKCGFVGTLNNMMYIKNRINKILHFSPNFYKHDSIYRLVISDKKHMLDFLSWLYNPIPIIKLDRKFKLAQRWIKDLTPAKVIWISGNRFVVGDCSSKSPSHVIGIKKEIIDRISRKWMPLEYARDELLADYDGCVKEDLSSFYNNGVLSASKPKTCGRKIMLHHNPHLWDVVSHNAPTIPESWNRKNIRRCLNILVDSGGAISTERLIREMQHKMRCGVTSLFYPALARNVIKMANLNGNDTIYDPCGGWGGRLIGSHIENINYICTEISNPTYAGLRKIKEFIGSNATVINSSCFEIEWPKSDLIFTSPPYFDTELYIHDTHASSKEQWIEEFVRPFIQRINSVCILYLNTTTLADFSGIRKPQKIVNVSNRKHPRAEISNEYLAWF